MNTKKHIQLIIKLAWRNVWKNKRRTILTLLTILVGSSMIILLNAWATGGHGQMIDDAVSANVGHIQIHEKGFWENRSIDYAFKFDKKLKNELQSYNEIESFTTRIYANGLLSFKNTTAGATIQGINPNDEKKVSTIYKNILPGGRYLNPNDKTDILIGETLAKNLEVKVGDSISMISQGFDGSIAAERLTIAGIFRSGNPEYDNFLIIMPIAQAMKTFTMMDYISAVIIRLKDSRDMTDVIEKIKSQIDTDKIEVMGWDELLPELVQFIVMDDFSAYIFDFILFMVVAFGILNTIQMSVFERIREFGIMLAIGTRPGQIISMVLAESAFISVLGIIIGISIGAAASYYFAINPIDYSQYSEEMKVWGVSTTIFPAQLTQLNVIVTSSLTFVLSILFSVFPAMRASRLKPIEAIRHL